MSRDGSYPPGVTGYEREIAGPDRAFMASRECKGPDCDFDGDVEIEEYHGTRDWSCPSCGHEHYEEVSEDAINDEAFDRDR